MPRRTRTVELAETEQLLDVTNRFTDLAVRFRVLRADGTEYDHVDANGAPVVLGGRWDRWVGCWKPTPVGELATVTWTIQEQQLPLLFGTALDVIFVALFAGRQAGKTFAAVMMVVLDALRYPGRKSAIVSLGYKESRDPESTFLSLLSTAWRVKAAKTDRSYTFPNGHVVVFRSVEAIETLRGPSLKTVLMDEAAYAKYSHFIAAIGCGAASKGFRIWLATTPKRESRWCREVNETWGVSMGHSKIYRLQTMQNPRRNEELLRAIEESTPADIVDQEFRGLITPPENAAYGRLFLRRLHVRPEGRLPEHVQFRLEKRSNGKPFIVDVTREWVKAHHRVDGAQYIAGWDFGKEAVVLGKIYRDTRIITEPLTGKQVRLTRDRLWIVGEKVNYNTSTDHHAADVAEEFGRNIFVITDAAGRTERSEGRGTDAAAIDILEAAGFIGVEPIGSKNPGVRHRVRTVRRALRSGKRPKVAMRDVDGFVPRERIPTDTFGDEWPAIDGPGGWGAGEVRLFFAANRRGLPIAAQTVDALENQRMINGKPEKDGKHEHVADALGYLVCAVLPVLAAIPEGWSRAGGDG